MIDQFFKMPYGDHSTSDERNFTRDAMTFENFLSASSYFAKVGVCSR